MRIVLKQEKILCVLKNPIPNVLTEDAKIEVRKKHQRHVDDDEQVACVMLTCMSPEL